MLRKSIKEKVANEIEELEEELRKLQLMEEKAAKERETIADSVEEAKLQAEENKDEILEDAKSNKDAIISEIHGVDAAAAERAAELKAGLAEKLAENQAENQNNFDAIKEQVDEGRKDVLHEYQIGLASSKKERQEENAQLGDDIVGRLGTVFQSYFAEDLKATEDMFNDTETGNARRRADALEIENRRLRAMLEAQRGSSTNRQLFPEKEEESKPKVPSTPILSAQNRANLPPSAAARSFAASEKHVESTRKENERKMRVAEAASKPAPLPPVVPTPRRSTRKPRPVKRV